MIRIIFLFFDSESLYFIIWFPVSRTLHMLSLKYDLYVLSDRGFGPEKRIYCVLDEGGGE